jgi:hypothetical protein
MIAAHSITGFLESLSHCHIDRLPRHVQLAGHYRLVLKEVGLPVQSFRNVRELIQVFRDALQGMFSHPAFISLADG